MLDGTGMWPASKFRFQVEDATGASECAPAGEGRPSGSRQGEAPGGLPGRAPSGLQGAQWAAGRAPVGLPGGRLAGCHLVLVLCRARTRLGRSLFAQVRD